MPVDTLVMVALHENLPAHRRAVEQECAFRDRYRARAGIEGTNSELKRRQGLGDLHVRGAARMEFALCMKLAACNVKRALKYWGQQANNAVATGKMCINSALNGLIDGPHAMRHDIMTAMMSRWTYPSYEYAAA